MAEQANFTQSRNDMHWSFWAGEDKLVRWSGYDDDYWWGNVAPTDSFRVKVGNVTGRRFTLDPEASTVQIEAALASAQAAK